MDVCGVNFVITDYGQHAAFNRGDQTSVQEPLPAWSCTTMPILPESGGIQPGRRRAGIGAGPWATPSTAQHGSSRAGCDDSQQRGATCSVRQRHGAGWDLPPEGGHRGLQQFRTRPIKDTSKCICQACVVHTWCCVAPPQAAVDPVVFYTQALRAGTVDRDNPYRFALPSSWRENQVPHLLRHACAEPVSLQPRCGGHRHISMGIKPA